MPKDAPIDYIGLPPLTAALLSDDAATRVRVLANEVAACALRTAYNDARVLFQKAAQELCLQLNEERALAADTQAYAHVRSILDRYTAVLALKVTALVEKPDDL